MAKYDAKHIMPTNACIIANIVIYVTSDMISMQMWDHTYAGPFKRKNPVVRRGQGRTRQPS